MREDPHAYATMEESKTQEQHLEPARGKDQIQSTKIDRNNDVEATGLDSYDDGSSTDSSTSLSSRLSRTSTNSDHCSEPKGVMTIPMHNERVPTGLDPGTRKRNDTIAWSAHVYDAKRNQKSRRRNRSPLDVDVRYVDHKPLMLTKQRRNKRRLRDYPEDDQDLPTERKQKKWRGPIIEILIHVRASIFDRFAPPPGYGAEDAEFGALDTTREASLSPPIRSRRGTRVPRSRSSSPDSIKWTVTKNDTLPVRIEGLSIDQRSRKSLVIRSPHLRQAICDCVGLSPRNISQADSKFYPTSWSSLLIFEEPYHFLLQNFADLVRMEGKRTKLSPNHDRTGNNDHYDLTSLQKEHLDVLIKFLQPLYEKLVKPCLRDLAQTKPQIEFGLLWYILKPITNVYVRDEHGAIQVCVIDEFYASQALSHPLKRSSLLYSSEWVAQLFFLITDGAKIGWQRISRSISWYPGLKDVIALDIVPCEIWDKTDNGKRRAEILQRGKLMEKILRQGFQLANYVPPRDSTNYKFSGKVVVDHRRGRNSLDAPLLQFHDLAFMGDLFDHSDIYVNTYQTAEDEIQVLRDSSRGRRSGRDYDDRYYVEPVRRRGIDDPNLDSKSRQLRGVEYDDLDISNGPSHDQTISPALTDQQLLLLQPRLLAFGLKTKQWISVDVSHLTEVKQSTESIDNLIIDAKELKMIKALSDQRNDSAEIWAADFIEGKGSGKIVLLHGPPGVGKTYTVESIAQWLDCPLLALTVADIGTIETRIESELLKWFSLAEAWNAVILVDEADIFLERRQNRDLARNGLVSAFLRRMEYFRGLLFLTTNRVGQIDDAFISRVHVAIEYKRLSGAYTRKIWEGFFRKLAKDRAGKIQVDSSAKKWVLEKFENDGNNSLNGRDIRNALQTAITLAEFESREDPDFDPSNMVVIVNKDHFERVLTMSNNFQDYVTSIRREDEKQRASGRLDRNDFRNNIALQQEAMSSTVAAQYLIPSSKPVRQP